MWKMTEKPRTILANPGLVDEFVRMEPAPYDRPLSERRMMIYERILAQGAFRPVVWASATCYETNATYRVNGKHTSLLLSRLTKLPDFYVTVERWGCDTLQDVGNLYNTYDSSLATRNASDINMAFAATIPGLRGIPGKLINYTVSAAAYLKWNESEIRKVSPAERAEELLDRHDFTIWLRDIITSTNTERQSNSRPILRTPVVTAMMATYDRAPNVAKEFWTEVREESAPKKDDPTRVLARYLVRAVLQGGRGTTTRQVVGFREVYVKCLHAWNAYRSGESTALQYYANAPIPKVSK